MKCKKKKSGEQENAGPPMGGTKKYSSDLEDSTQKREKISLLKDGEGKKTSNGRGRSLIMHDREEGTLS